MKTKQRYVIYHHGSDSAAAAKDRALELRAEGNVARTIDSTNFSDIEDTDKIEYIGDFPAEVKAAIRDGYEKIDKRVFTRELSMHNGDGSVAIDIPEQWTQMSWPEMQKLAAALTDETVRTKEAAISVIEAELERREEKLHADLKTSDPAGGAGQPTGKKTTSSEDDGDGDDDQDDDEFSGMTKAQLKAHADENEIDLEGASRKDEILAKVRAHKAD